MHYLNLFDALAEEGLDGTIAAVRRAARESGATLIVIDGAAVIEDMAPSQFELRRFIQQLQAQVAILGATTMLLTGHTRDQLAIFGAHVDGVLSLANERFDSRHVRSWRCSSCGAGAMSLAPTSSRSPRMALRSTRG